MRSLFRRLVNYRHFWPALIVIITALALGNIVIQHSKYMDSNREIIQLLNERAQEREAETREIHDDIDDLRGEIYVSLELLEAGRAEWLPLLEDIDARLARIEHAACGGPCPEVEEGDDVD